MFTPNEPLVPLGYSQLAATRDLSASPLEVERSKVEQSYIRHSTCNK